MVLGNSASGHSGETVGMGLPSNLQRFRKIAFAEVGKYEAELTGSIHRREPSLEKHEPARTGHEDR